MANVESLIFDILAKDNASSAFIRAGKSAKDAAGDVQSLTDRLVEVSKQSVDARVGLTGNKEANAEVDSLQAKLIALGRQAANPNISVQGALRVEQQIAAVSVALDTLKAKSDAAAVSQGVLANQQRVLKDSLRGEISAHTEVSRAMDASTKSAKLLQDAEATLAEGDAVLAGQLHLVKGKLEEVSAAADGPGGATGALSGLAGGGTTGMGALIGAAAVLSPVLVTVGTGLVGLGAAAYGLAKPIETAAQKTGGLQANLKSLNPEQQTVAKGLLNLGTNFSAFQAAVQPEVMGVFNKGLQLAGSLLHDIQPVTIAVGKGFEEFIGQIDTAFNSGTWTGFWSFMARTAEPDMRLLGQDVAALVQDLPLMLQALQPVATGALNTLRSVEQLPVALSKVSASTSVSPSGSGGLLGFLAQAGSVGSSALNNFVNYLTTAQGKTDEVATSLGGLGHALVSTQQGFAQADPAMTRFGASAEGARQQVEGAATASRDLSNNAAAAQRPLAGVAGASRDLSNNAAAAQKSIAGVAGANRDLSNNAAAAARSQNLAADATKQATKDNQDFTGVITKAYKPTFDLYTAVNDLTAAMQHNDSTVLTLQGDDISWRQALDAADKQLASNSAGLKGNSANAEANKQAILQSTQQAQQLAEQELHTHDGVQKASQVIQQQIKWLQQHGEKSKFAAQEIAALRAEEARLQNIRQQISVTGSGHWNVVQSNLRGPQPGKSYKAGFAAGTAGAPPGWAWVGERGPELVHMTGGETVLPHGVSMGVTRGYASGVTGSYSGTIPGLTGFLGREASQTVGAIAASVAGAINSAISSASAGAVSGAVPGGGAPAANAALARRMMPAWGSGAEWAAWNAVAMAESGWNQFARNPSSGAYGIPQALPPGKMGAAANPPQSNPGAQIAWMISYIRSVYGDPIAAGGHEQALHWYDKGGTLKPGLTLAYNGTGRNEQVVPPGGQKIVLEVKASHDTALEKFIVGMVQKYVIVHGGDAQVALGQRV